MPYYIRIHPEDGKSLGVWNITERFAERLGVTRDAPGSYFEAMPGETVWDAIKRQAAAWFPQGGSPPFHRIDLEPGHFYPRMARPLDQHPTDSPGFSRSEHLERNAVAEARGQMNALVSQLNRLCQTVHPTEETLKVYGHDIRNLLILASTEVEMHWRGVLTANGLTKQRYTTNDYVLLSNAMKLNEYVVGILPFPWLEPFIPFKGWGTTGRPTQEIPWFDSYNATKHDRETKFSHATLQSAFEAVCACYIMIAAQYGAAEVARQLRFQSFFELRGTPMWAPKDVYTLPYGTLPEKWIATPYPFSFP